jgi:hypothetical protein
MHMRILGQNIDTTLSRDQTANPKLEIYTADCAHVTGDWTAGISQGISDNGGDSNITGPFSAYNFADSLVDAEIYNDYMTDVGQFLGDVRAGNFRHGDLSSLLIRAEALERLLRNAPACVVPSGFFFLMSYSLVADLLNYVLEHPGDYTTDDLAFITRAGVRSGVLGAGAPDQPFAQRIESSLKAAFDGRLTHAISEEDRGAVLEIMELAYEMGWSDQVARAAQFLYGG